MMSHPALLTHDAPPQGLHHCRGRVPEAFETQYYNAEIHQADFAQPEFFRRALAQAFVA